MENYPFLLDFPIWCCLVILSLVQRSGGKEDMVERENAGRDSRIKGHLRGEMET